MLLLTHQFYHACVSRPISTGSHRRQTDSIISDYYICAMFHIRYSYVLRCWVKTGISHLKKTCQLWVHILVWVQEVWKHLSEEWWSSYLTTSPLRIWVVSRCYKCTSGSTSGMVWGTIIVYGLWEGATSCQDINHTSNRSICIAWQNNYDCTLLSVCEPSEVCVVEARHLRE